MNKYNVNYRANDTAVEQVIEADGFQLGPVGGNIIFIIKGDKGEVTATHFISNVSTVLLTAEPS